MEINLFLIVYDVFSSFYYYLPDISQLGIIQGNVVIHNMAAAPADTFDQPLIFISSSTFFMLPVFC
jgi:hypothetical protein